MTANIGRVAIWGVGGHAHVVAAAARMCGWTVDCFVEAPQTGLENDAVVIRLATAEQVLETLRKRKLEAVFLGFGHCQGRKDIGEKLSNAAFVLPVLVHPAAYVASSSKLGIGVFVGAGAVIDPGVSVGRFSIINNGAVICHDTSIGDASHICPGTVVAGACTIGERCWVGAGSILREHLRIVGGTFLGCGSVVVKSIDKPCLVFGNPAQYRGAAPESF